MELALARISGEDRIRTGNILILIQKYLLC